MAIITREELKTYFVTGKVPNQKNYWDLIDTIYDITGAGLTIHGSTHKHGGLDEIATSIPGINEIVKSGADGKIAVGWIPSIQYDHGGLSGLGDDDHNQYLNLARHDILSRHSLGTVVPHDDHGLLSGLSDNDHPQYPLKTADETISGNYSFSDPAPRPPFSIGISQQGKTVIGFRADQLDKTITGSNGLAGGGSLTGNVNLWVDQSYQFQWTNIHQHANHIWPMSNDLYDLGASDRIWRKAYISEMNSFILKENSISVLGGYMMIGKGQGSIPEEFPVEESGTYDFGPGLLEAEDVILFKANGAIEYMVVHTPAGGTEWVTERNIDGTGANVWPSGSVWINLGHGGDGRLEFNAVDTPRFSIMRQWTDMDDDEVLRIGDMNGFLGIIQPNKYGFGVGNETDHLIYDGEDFKILTGAGSITLDSLGIDVAGVNTHTLINSDGIEVTFPDGILQINDSGFIVSGGGYTLINKDGFYFSQNQTEVSIDQYGFNFENAAGSMSMNHNGIGINAYIATSPSDYSALNSIRFRKPEYPDTHLFAIHGNYLPSTDHALLHIGNWNVNGKPLVTEIQMNSVATGATANSLISVVSWGVSPSRKSALYLETNQQNLGFSNARLEADDVKLTASRNLLMTGNWTGWVKDPDIWLYATSNQFTVVNKDVTARFPIGTKIRLTDGAGYKYYYVTATYFVTGHSYIFITNGNGSGLSGSTIANNYYSYEETPQDFPIWFDWTPTFTGFSTNPTGYKARFCVRGRTVTAVYNDWGGTPGTSNQGPFLVSAPIQARAIGAYWMVPMAYAVDTGISVLNTLCYIASGGTVFELYKSSFGLWSSSGVKSANFTITYEI